MTEDRSRWWPLGRAAVAAVVVGALVWHVGSGPFLDGLRAVDAVSLAVALAVGLVTTVCCAWRWRLVARGLRVDVPLGAGVASYYRSQFLNSVLPGGVLGDVHRAVDHGREVGNVAVGARTVAWERSAGQGVQAVLTVAALLLLPSPVHDVMPRIAGVVVAGAVVVWLVVRTVPATGASWWARGVRTLRRDVRDGFLTTRAWVGVVLASAAVVAGHVTCFVMAARTAGSTAEPSHLVPLALLVLLAMSLPLSLGGWGPREGVAAWAFAAAGLGAALGVATAVVYGVMVLVATLPGLVLLAVGAARRAPAKDADPLLGAVAHVVGADGRHG